MGPAGGGSGPSEVGYSVGEGVCFASNALSATLPDLTPKLRPPTLCSVGCGHTPPPHTPNPITPTLPRVPLMAGHPARPTTSQPPRSHPAPPSLPSPSSPPPSSPPPPPSSDGNASKPPCPPPPALTSSSRSILRTPTYPPAASERCSSTSSGSRSHTCSQGGAGWGGAGWGGAGWGGAGWGGVSGMGRGGWEDVDRWA